MPHSVEFSPPESPFLSLMHWMDRAGQVPLNLLQGRPDAAGRQLTDFLGEIPDALLPGDVIPNVTRRGDDTTTSKALGLDDDTSPWITTPLDFAGGIVTNPLSFAGGAPAKLVGSVGKAALGAARDLAPGAVGKAEKEIGKLAFKAKRTLGYRSLRPEDEQLLQDSRQLRKNSEGSLAAHYDKVFAGLDEAHQNALGDAFDNLRWKDGKVTGLIDDTTALPAGSSSTIQDQIARIQKRAAVLAAGDPALDVAKLQEAIPKMLETNQRMWQEGVDKKVFSKQEGSPYGLADYLQRHFNFDDMDGASIDELASGMPSAIKGRATALSTDKGLADYLQAPENAKVRYERNAVKRSLKRAENQGRLLERANIGSSVVKDPNFFLAGKNYQDLAVSKIEELKGSDPELGHALEDSFKGLAPRGMLPGLLAKANSYWKPYVVYGIFAPKIGSIVRNVVGGGFQVASTPEAAKALKNFVSPKNLGQVFGGAIDDGIERVMGTRLGGGTELTKSIQRVEKAMEESGGTVDGMMAHLADDPVLQGAAKHGVLDGFVTSEEVGKRLVKGGLMDKAPKWLKDWAQMPGDIFQGAEQRMRLGTYLSLVKEAGYTPERAAAAVRDAFYDYNVWNKSNRTLRDVIPFAAFQTNAARQSAKWIARQPAVGVAAGQLFQGSDPDHPTPEWVSEQASVRLGPDKEGNPQYATGFGLPIESLNGIPGLSGREFMRTVVSKMAPAIKQSVAGLTGEDPYFGTPVGSYDKTPEVFQALGAGEHSELGRQYHNLTSWGLNPLDPLVGQVGKLLDKKKSATGTGLDLLTGANVVSVDENQALQQLLQRSLDANPQVRKHTSMYTMDGDQETKDILAEYNRVKGEVKKHRAAQQLAAMGID